MANIGKLGKFVISQNFWRSIKMDEIIFEHNGVKYSKEELIKLLDLVFEIMGEDI
jgi:hypothetical protein